MSFTEYLERSYLPDLGNLPEEEIAAVVVTALESTFLFEREVWGTHCSGRRLRIDAVVRPRDPAGWYDDAPLFGLEFKGHAAQGAEALAQCVDYGHTEWDGYGVLPVFLCPAVVSRWAWRAGGAQSAWLVQRMMGQLGIGELDWVKYPESPAWRLEKSGARVWDSNAGPGRGPVSSLAVKVGHR